MGKSERTIELDAAVHAPIDEVWAAWTTSEGCATFFAPACDVDARPGGTYTMWFDPDAPEGARGSEGCTVLEVDPPGRLVFSWNNPTALAAIRNAHTRVTLTLRPTDDGTHVHLRQDGFGDGPHWDQALAFFERAWDLVLMRLARSFDEGPHVWADQPRG